MQNITKDALIRAALIEALKFQKRCIARMEDQHDIERNVGLIKAVTFAEIARDSVEYALGLIGHTE